ncbi:hypothetical protein FKM82_016747 [Ascaphus truei]
MRDTIVNLLSGMTEKWPPIGGRAGKCPAPCGCGGPGRPALELRPGQRSGPNFFGSSPLDCHRALALPSCGPPSLSHIEPFSDTDACQKLGPAYIWCQKWDERWSLKFKGAPETTGENVCAFACLQFLQNSLSNKTKNHMKQ